jgi:predicted secreted protein
MVKRIKTSNIDSDIKVIDTMCDPSVNRKILEQRQKKDAEKRKERYINRIDKVLPRHNSESNSRERKPVQKAIHK